MSNIITSLIVLAAVFGTTYYIVFKDLPREDESYYAEHDHGMEYGDMHDMDMPGPQKTPETTNNTPTAPVTQTPAPTQIPPAPVQETPKPESITVRIRSFAFNPSIINIKPGTKVTWINEDSASHTVTSNSGSLLNSGMISPGGSFTFTFTGAGSEGYHCAPHPFMKGTVVVAN